MCTNVLSDYQLKSREKLTLDKSNETNAQASQSEDFHAQELTTQLQNLTPIISTHILRNLFKL